MDQRNQEHQSKAPICTPRGDASATPTFHGGNPTTPGSDNALAPGLERETWLARSASPLPVPQYLTHPVEDTPPSPYTEPKHRSHPRYTPLQPQTPHRAPPSWVPSYVSGPPGNISWAGAVFSGPEPDGGPERGLTGYDHDHGYGYECEYAYAMQAGPPAGVFAHDPAGPAPRTPLWVPAPDVDPEDDVSPFVLGSSVYGVYPSPGVGCVYPSPPGTPRRGSGR